MKMFILAHKDQIIALAIPAAYAIACEILAHCPKVASNSVSQALMAAFKKVVDKEEAASKTNLPPAA
jgi:hypothetical protein